MHGKEKVKMIVMKYRILLFIVGTVFILSGLFWWYSRTEESVDYRISVSATIYPLAFLAEQIGGDLVSVKTVVPRGIEPHDFDPSLRDIADMYRSKLILINGAGIDTWAERLEVDFLKQGILVSVFSRSVDLTAVTDDEAEHAVASGMSDPHFWLDPVMYKESARAVLQELIDIDPAHAATYRMNFGRFERNIAILDDHLRELSGPRCHLDTVIVSHNAFSYLARRYGFEIRSLAGINPEQEVSIGELAGVIRLMQEKNILYVLTEPIGNMDVATTIRKETGAEISTLDPLEGLLQSDANPSEDYFTVMNRNWITLRKALECE